MYLHCILNEDAFKVRDVNAQSTSLFPEESVSVTDLLNWTCLCLMCDIDLLHRLSEHLNQFKLCLILFSQFYQRLYKSVFRTGVHWEISSLHTESFYYFCWIYLWKSFQEMQGKHLNLFVKMYRKQYCSHIILQQPSAVVPSVLVLGIVGPMNDD